MPPTSAALQHKLSEATHTITHLKQNSVLALDGKLTLATTDGRPTALFTGVNIQLVNGEGETYAFNGLGNLLIGYDRPRDDGIPSDKSGSHYLVIGNWNNYSASAGLMLDAHNTSNVPRERGTPAQCDKFPGLACG